MPFAWGRPLQSYGKVQQVVGSLIRNRQSFIDKRAIGAKRLLNIGCGSNIDPAFVNLDYGWRPGIDICWDIRNPLPLPDVSMAGVFTEHCLEHVSYGECISVLKEVFRILRPEGAVRVIVPDGGLYLRLYQETQEGKRVEFPYVGAEGLRDLEEDRAVCFTPMLAVNRIFRGYGHQFAFDFETLASMLSHVGFVQIRKEKFRTGRRPDLLIDSELRAPQSLVVEAVKP